MLLISTLWPPPTPRQEISIKQSNMCVRQSPGWSQNPNSGMRLKDISFSFSEKNPAATGNKKNKAFVPVRPFILLVIFAAVFAARLLHAEETSTIFGQAQELMRRQQFAAAVPLLEKCVVAEPGSSRFHQWLGRALGLQAAQKG